MQSRQVVTGVTLLVLCGVLVLGAVLGWRSLFAELPDPSAETAAPAAPCETEDIEAGQRLRSTQVRVSVYNAGTRSGLADSTLDSLTERGFRRGTVGNAPEGTDVSRVRVLTTTENDAEAKLVARQFGKRTPVEVSEVDLGPGVDVVVGNDFERLRRASRSIEIENPEDVCVPVGESPGTNAAG